MTDGQEHELGEGRTPRQEHEREDLTAAESSLDELPKFPLDALPPALATYCHAATSGIDPEMPPDAVALPILSVIGGLIGNRLGLEIKPRAWIEYPGLYTAIVAESGTAKSAALKAATLPVRKIEHRIDAEYDAEMAKYQREKEEYKEYKSTVKGLPVSSYSMHPPLPPRGRRRIITTDTTFEASVVNLEHTPGMILVRDELAGWVSGMDAYRGGRGGDRQRWLEIWSNTDIAVDRKIDGTIKIRSPLIGVIGGIQPPMLPYLQPDPSLVDGFIERLLFTMHRLRIPDWSDAYIPGTVWDDVQATLEALDQIPAMQPVPGEPVGIMLHMTRDARVLYTSWYREVAERARKESNGSLRAYFSKLRTNCLRIAVINHAVWAAESDPTAMIDASTIEMAIAIAAYTEPHYRAFLAEAQRQRMLRKDPVQVHTVSRNDKQPVPIRVLSMIDGAGGRITRASLTRRLGNIKAVDLDAALDVLLADGTLKEEQHGSGRKSTRIYGRNDRNDRNGGGKDEKVSSDAGRVPGASQNGRTESHGP